MVFLKALDDVSAEEQGTLALKCEVSDPQARVVWHKDGVELGSGHKYDFLHTAGMRGLVVHDLSQNDAGLYTCRVGSEETRSVVSVHGAWPVRAAPGAMQALRAGRGLGTASSPSLLLSKGRGCFAEPVAVSAGSGRRELDAVLRSPGAAMGWGAKLWTLDRDSTEAEDVHSAPGDLCRQVPGHQGGSQGSVLQLASGRG